MFINNLGNSIDYLKKKNKKDKVIDINDINSFKDFFCKKNKDFYLILDSNLNYQKLGKLINIKLLCFIFT